MSKITIEINDSRKADALVRFLREIPDISVTVDNSGKGRDASQIKRLFGLWKGRSVDLSRIRSNAWLRK